MMSPACGGLPKALVSAVLTSAIPGPWTIVVTSGSSSPVVVPLSSVTTVPKGSVPLAVAWLVTVPASISAWLIG